MKRCYEDFCDFGRRKNKPNSKPIKPNFKTASVKGVGKKGCREVVSKTTVWNKNWIPAFAGMTAGRKNFFQLVLVPVSDDNTLNCF